MFDSEPEAEIDDNVENDQVRLIDRNRVFEHLKFSNLFSYPILFI